jgi:hypothetical protein
MDKMPYFVGLTIGHGGKGIPYGGYHNGEMNDDGTAKNRGFKNLKGRPHLLERVPELSENPGLYELVAAINQPETGLVSVGCAGWDKSNVGGEGHRWEGYIEFAVNTAELVADPHSYFALFFAFDRHLRASGFDQPVNYHWELERADFSPTKVSGFTCCIRVMTPFAESLEEAKETWQQALKPLVPILGSVPPQDGTPLFTPDMDCDMGS